MRLILKSFASLTLIVLLTGLESHGQKFAPHTFMVGIDIPGIPRSIASPNRNMGEIQMSTNLASHLFIVEYGFEKIDRKNADFELKTKGPYFRTGVDFTLNPKNPQGHKIFTGFRYGQSNYKNSLDYQVESDAFGNQQLSVNNNNIKGTWLEWTFGMKLMLMSNLAMGYTMRYKFSQTITGGETLTSFDLPGYGRARKRSNFGLSYYLLYRIKFRKEKEPKS